MVDQEEEDEDEDIYTVLKVEGGYENAKPYYMGGFINGNKVKVIINSGSPVTIFAPDELKQVMKRDKREVPEMIKARSTWSLMASNKRVTAWH